MEIDSAKERSTQPFDLQPVLKGNSSNSGLFDPRISTNSSRWPSDPLIWGTTSPQGPLQGGGVSDLLPRSPGARARALLATDVRDGRIIGSSRFHGYDPETSEIEIGWTFLARSHWGGRYNARNEATHASPCVQVCRPGRLSHRPTESSLQRAVERIGAVRVGSRPDANGRESLFYQITLTAVRSP